MEEDGHVEDDGVDGDCADEVGEYEVAAWGAGEEINRHDGAGGVILDVDEEWRANDEDGEGGEDKGMCPGVNVASGTLSWVRGVWRENKGYLLEIELEAWSLL